MPFGAYTAEGLGAAITRKCLLTGLAASCIMSFMDDKDRFRISARIHGVGVYERALEAARAELRKLLKWRQAIDRRTNNLQRFTGTVISICEEDGVPLPPDLLLPFDEDVPLSLSLIDAVRAVLKVRGAFMTVAEVRDSLLAMELDLHKLWNPTALVRMTLKRLLERGEVSGEPEDKPVRYRWRNPVAEAQELDPTPTILRTGDETRGTPGDEGAEMHPRSEPAARRTSKLAILTAFLRNGVV